MRRFIPAAGSSGRREGAGGLRRVANKVFGTAARLVYFCTEYIIRSTRDGSPGMVWCGCCFYRIFLLETLNTLANYVFVRCLQLPVFLPPQLSPFRALVDSAYTPESVPGASVLRGSRKLQSKYQVPGYTSPSAVIDAVFGTLRGA